MVVKSGRMGWGGWVGEVVGLGRAGGVVLWDRVGVG